MMRRWLLKLSEKDSLSFFVQRKLVLLKLIGPFLDGLLFCLPIQKLNLPVTYLEIKVTLWSIKPFKIKPFKAPDPDGLHAGFFPKFLVVC